MLFLYGPLAWEPLFTLVAGADPVDWRAHRLAGRRLVRRAGGDWPGVVEQDAAGVDGWLAAPDPAARARIAAYCGMCGLSEQRLTIDGVTATFWAAAGDGAAADWRAEEWLRRDAPTALIAAAEPDYTRPPAELAAEWRMVRGRASAHFRAQTTETPATIRHRAGTGEVALREAAPMAGHFFRYAALSVSHRRFDGEWHRDLPREVLVGSDAALVLPYDPVRDRVLLVEQFRAAPARRGDPNPWTLEPVAGMIDPGETPEEAARREAAEEAHLTDLRLEKMFAVYASPGNATDFFHCYLGIADLPDGGARHGGLLEEAEDIRLHLVDFEAALAMIASGEVNVGPLAGMLLWLAHERGRLRGAAPG